MVSSINDSATGLRPDPSAGSWALAGPNGPCLASATDAPFGAFAIRRHGEWQVLGVPDTSNLNEWRWHDSGAMVRFFTDESGAQRITLSAPGAEATALAWQVGEDEHFYGLGERFDALDQRGKLVDLWVTNGAAGGETYKPVPWVLSTQGYGMAVETSFRTYASLAQGIFPGIGAVIVENDELSVALFVGETPADVLGDYTAWIGRPPVPPAWFFRPWKSRDWRAETQETVLDDLRQHANHDLPLGVKLIDAMWETEDHTFDFTPERYDDVPAMMDELRAAGVELVLWVSPNITTGSETWEYCRREGFLIGHPEGDAYVHRLGNAPGWEGSAIDFTNPGAVAWWQGNVRKAMELGVAGLKTDFGEQVPVDAVFHDGRTGAELHNLLPVLYNQATWEVVREYDGALLARSAWAGSQRYPGIWSGDQSADFSPWAGLPSAIVAGLSAGMSGFPYWGSDVGGYFNPPDEEVFIRWAQFGAVSPVMEVHGLGVREPWLFGQRALDAYREAARLHDSLVPYAIAASREATATGLPLMRAMPLVYPEQPAAHQDWVQFQYLYGPDLLAAPVYSWGTTRPLWFPPGEWVDLATGERFTGPADARVEAPLEKLPLYARAGSVIPFAEPGALVLRLYPGNQASESQIRLDDGPVVRFVVDASGEARLEIGATERELRIDVPFGQVEIDPVPARSGPTTRTFRWIP